MKNPYYLGDGAYVHQDERGIVLTTGDHRPEMADNVIVLGSRELQSLMNYLQQEQIINDK